MNPDPSGLVDGTNTYIYCGADPINHFDPDGNMMRSLADAALRQNPRQNRSTGTPEPGEDTMGGAQRDLVPPPREERDSSDRQRGNNIFGNYSFAKLARALQYHADQKGAHPSKKNWVGLAAKYVRAVDTSQSMQTYREVTKDIAVTDLALTSADTAFGYGAGASAGAVVKAFIPRGASPLAVVAVTLVAFAVAAVVQNRIESEVEEKYGKSPASRLVKPAAELAQTAHGFKSLYSLTTGAAKPGGVLDQDKIVSAFTELGAGLAVNTVQEGQAMTKRVQEGSDNRREREMRERGR
jgi:hypothetical protein